MLTGQTSEVTLENVSVPASSLLGKEGEAFAALEEVIDLRP